MHIMHHVLSCFLAHNVAQLDVSCHIVWEAALLGGGAKCSQVAAVMLAGSSPRAVPGHCSCQFQ